MAKSHEMIVIPADDAEPIRMVTLANDATRLQRLQELVGGYIEGVEGHAGGKIVHMYVNEDGIRLDLPHNPRATRLVDASRTAVRAPGLRGDAVVWKIGSRRITNDIFETFRGLINAD